MDTIIAYLPLVMLALLPVLLFSGLPVGLVLSGLGLLFALIGIATSQMHVMELYAMVSRLYSVIGENLVFPAVPMMLMMGLLLERSGIARELLLCLQILLCRVPGNLSISLALLGLILAPSASLIGASVVTLALVAMPTMLAQGYRASLTAGSIAASGTLGIIFPPAIMLFFLADLLGLRIGYIFLAPIIPVLLLLVLYIAYFALVGVFQPSAAPRIEAKSDEPTGWKLAMYAMRSLFLPVALIAIILGSIVGGFATPTQSGAVGAAGALLLTVVNRSISFALVKDVLERTVILTCMVFFVVIGAAIFSYTFRSLYGDPLILGLIEATGLESWQMSKSH